MYFAALQQPEKDLHRCPTAAEVWLPMYIGMFKLRHYSYGYSYGRSLNMPMFEWADSFQTLAADLQTGISVKYTRLSDPVF